MEPQYALKTKDGRFVRCYYWSLRCADFGTDMATSWRGTQAEAENLQREWDYGSRPTAVPFTLRRYIVQASFCASSMFLHTYAADREGAIALFMKAFTKEQRDLVLGSRSPSCASLDEADQHMARFWKGHGYTHYGS